MEGSHRADRYYNGPSIRGNSELKAACRLAISTETFPPLFGRQAGTDLGVGHGLPSIVHHCAPQHHAGLQGDVEDGSPRHLDSLYRCV